MRTPDHNMFDVETEELAKLDLESEIRVTGGRELLAALTENGAYRTMQSSWIEIDLTQPVDTYRDIAAGQNVSVLADTTVFLIEGGIALYTQTVPASRQILAGPGDDFVTVLCDDRIVWLDPSDKLEKVGSSELSADSAEREIRTTSGRGWTVINAGSMLYCHQEPMDDRTRLLEVDVDRIIEDGEITDISFLHEDVVISTTNGIFGVNISTDGVQTWSNTEFPISRLSSPANHYIYGWSEANLFQISPSGELELAVDSHVDDICTSTNHRLSYIRSTDEDEASIRRRSPESSVSVSVDSIRYNERTELLVELTNQKTSSVRYKLHVQVQNAERAGGENAERAGGDGSLEAEVPPLSSETHTVGELRVRERVDSVPITVYDEVTDSEVVDSEIPVEHGTPEVRAEARVTRIDHGEPDIRVEVSNSGTGTAYVAFTRNDPDNVHTIRPDESETLSIPADGSRGPVYYKGTAPSSEFSPVRISTDREYPDKKYSVDSRVGPDRNTICTRLQSHVGVEICEEVCIRTGATEQLKGEVTIPADGRCEIWHPMPDDSFSITQVAVEGDGIIETESEQINPHPFLDVNRKFTTTSDEEISPDELPVAERFKERLFVCNGADSELSKLLISGAEQHRVAQLQPDEKVIVSRQVALPSADLNVPPVTIAVISDAADLPEKEQSVELTGQWSPCRPEYPVFTASLCKIVNKIYLLLVVERRSGEASTLRLDELTISSASLLEDTDVERTFQPGEIHRRRIPLRFPGINFRDISPQTVEAKFTLTQSGQSIRRSTLASADSTTRLLNPDIRDIGARAAYNDLVFDSEADLEAKIEIFAGQSKIKTVRKSLRAESTTRLRFETTWDFVSVSVTGASDSSFEKQYKFRRRENGWNLENISGTPKSLNQPIVTSWSESD